MRGETRYFCLIMDFGRNSLNFYLSSIVFSSGLFYIAIIIMDYDLSITKGSIAFCHKGMLNAFSTFIEMNIVISLPSVGFSTFI